MKKFLIIFLFIPFIISAQAEVPALSKFATDLTGSLSRSELEDLNWSLSKFYDSTSTQVVFLMISSLDGESLESYSYNVAYKNKIGQQGRNNGILFLVVKSDKKMRIEVGYGLEGVLPDALASSILRNEVRPYFIEGDYFGGIKAGINSILAATKGEYKADPKKDKKKKERGGTPFGILGFIIIVFIIKLITGGRGRGGGIGPGIFIGGMGGFGGSSRGGFGGFSGGSGGFGGFSGGGGSFGGGGASGGW